LAEGEIASDAHLPQEGNYTLLSSFRSANSSRSLISNELLKQELESLFWNRSRSQKSDTDHLWYTPSGIHWTWSCLLV